MIKATDIYSIPTVIGVLERSIKTFPEKTGLRYFNTSITYADIGKYVRAYAQIFSTFLGNAVNERIAIFTPNIPQFVFSYFGAPSSGNIAVPVNFASVALKLRNSSPYNILITEEIRAQFQNADPKIIVVADLFFPILAQMGDMFLKDKVLLVVRIKDHLDLITGVAYEASNRAKGTHIALPEGNNIHLLKSLVDDKKDFPSFPCGSSNDIIQFQYTGGTTGEPKGVMLSNRNITANLEQCLRFFENDLALGESILGTLPLCHVYGLLMLNMSIALGGTFTLMPSFSPSDALRLVEKNHITVFPGMNRMFESLLSIRKMSKYDLSSLKFFMSGASPLILKTKIALEEKTGKPIHEGYGESEASPVISICKSKDWRPSRVGKPVFGTEIEIIDPTTTPRNSFKEGEICVRGPQVMSGYYKNPEATKEVLQNGLLHTGDIGGIDDEGFLWITDRKKDMIKVNGENIYPRGIEMHFLKSGSVAKCAVIGVPDEKMGEAIILVYVLSSPFDTSLFFNTIQSLPSPSLRPRETVPVSLEQFAEWEEITGKLKKRLIKKFYLEQHYHSDISK